MPRPLILFGAFDRHNFGDLLFPHLAAALLPGRELIFAGLAARDLRIYGGHAVQALSEVCATLGTRPAELLHVGGEILTTSAWQAAVMLLPSAEAQATLAYLRDRPAEQAAWVQRMVGSAAQAPYTLSRASCPAVTRVAYLAVGGVALNDCTPALRAEVLANLQAADVVSVRDVQTLAQLTAAGLTAQLLPDPAVMVAALFGDRLRRQAAQGEVAQMRRTLTQGYLAVQFSAEFADDATLATLAAQLDQVAAATGLGIVLFRAGAAPWHDDLAGLRRVAARLRTPSVRVFESLDIWDICALIAHGRAYGGSSLHGRIVAMACAVPRINLRPPGVADECGKQAAFVRTWEDRHIPGTVAVDGLAAGLLQALALDTASLQHSARQWVRQFRQGYTAVCGVAQAAREAT